MWLKKLKIEKNEMVFMKIYNIFLQNYKLSTLIIILPMCQKRILHHPAIILSVYYQVFQFRKSLLEPYHKLQDFHWQSLRKDER